VIAAMLVVTLSGCGGNASTDTTRRPPAPAVSGRHVARAPFAVGVRTITLVDTSRLVRFPGRPAQPRTLVTIIRYPASGRPGNAELADAAPARAADRFPLVIFGHGFAVTPKPYARLLHAWAQAGYVVAAPIFPLENANAPGGPNESDLINQPSDMSFVISRLEMAGAASTGFLDGLIARREVAVTGQSDGGETALAAAYDRSFLDHRIRAVVILSGATTPGHGGFAFPMPSPPLLATQGTADAINPARLTNAFFASAARPKYLLTLLGAGHLSPYTNAQPQLGIVQRVSLGFLDRYLKGDRSGLSRMITAGNRAGVAELAARP
jgi:predicted dienelactone hydrolase